MGVRIKGASPNAAVTAPLVASNVDVNFDDDALSDLFVRKLHELEVAAVAQRLASGRTTVLKETAALLRRQSIGERLCKCKVCVKCVCVVLLCRMGGGENLICYHIQLSNVVISWNIVVEHSHKCA